MTNKEIIDKGISLLIQDNGKLFDSVSKVFPTTTENIKDIYSNFDLKGKDILTVASSGDHALCAMLAGVNKIDVFDLNILTDYYFQLKKAIIKTYDNYKDFENILFYNIISNGFISKPIYEKIRNNLEGKYLEFWDIMFDISYRLNIRINNIFFDFPKEIYEYVNYLNSKNYKIVRNKLEHTQINFIETDIFNLHKKINQKYDYIFLSNIADYIGIKKVKKYSKKKLLPSINKNGEILYAYLYSVENNNNENAYEIESFYQYKDYVLTLRK